MPPDARQLPIDPSKDVQSFDLALDGITYRFRWVYLRRIDGYLAHLRTREGTPLRLGQRVISAASLFESHGDPRFPPGRFVVTGQDVGLPTRGELGAGVQVLYFPAEESG